VFDGRLHRNREEQGKQPGNSSATAASSGNHNVDIIVYVVHIIVIFIDVNHSGNKPTNPEYFDHCRRSKEQEYGGQQALWGC
jgi:hypothetical protein